MLEELKRQVLEANMELYNSSLALLTWGNASGIDRERGLVVIKPSGVPYEKLTAEDMVVVDLSGRVIEGSLKPSSDTATHIQLYISFPDIGGVAHTHSPYAVAFSQAAKDILPYGTTHADFAFGAIPCTRDLTAEEIEVDYELNTGRVIAEYFNQRAIDYNAVPAALVHSHGPFTWGKDCEDASHNSIILEEVARMAFMSEALGASTASEAIQKKHYFRKHGAGAYYGQG